VDLLDPKEIATSIFDEIKSIGPQHDESWESRVKERLEKWAEGFVAEIKSALEQVRVKAGDRLIAKAAFAGATCLDCGHPPHVRANCAVMDDAVYGVGHQCRCGLSG
jgi:hypothetical protein